MTAFAAFDRLAAAAEHSNCVMPGPDYVLEIMDDGEWVPDDDYPSLDHAADHWLSCTEQGLTARIIETHYDGDRVDLTREAKDRIRAWNTKRGDPVPPCVETDSETAARERAEALAEASATRGCDRYHNDKHEGME